MGFDRDDREVLGRIDQSLQWISKVITWSIAWYLFFGGGEPALCPPCNSTDPSS